MATQRVTTLTILGTAADHIRTRVNELRTSPNPAAVDVFVRQLQQHRCQLPIVAYVEWIDRWLMFDHLQGPVHVSGSNVDVSCVDPNGAIAWADRCGTQFDEQIILAARLREAANVWEGMAEPRLIVVIREMIGPSTDDENIRAAAINVPNWLQEI